MSLLGLMRSLVPLFADRRDAGRKLAEHLRDLAGEHPVVIGLPRGGVPVAAEVARALDAPLDVLIVRKIGCPVQPELGVGAVGEDGALMIDLAALTSLGIPREDVEPTIKRERAELQRRKQLYRRGRDPISVSGRTVILVDDGIATGGTARVAADVLRQRGAARIVLAVPVAPPGAAERFAGHVDDFVCIGQPAGFYAVGQAYASFPQTSDEEVSALLEAARVELRPVEIPAGTVRLRGDLRLPPAPHGLVLFAHGSGSSRHSPRNVQVADALTAGGCATLLLDLLTEEEATDRRAVFDIELLAGRLVAASRWACARADTADLLQGYFGASTGAAAALGAAAQLPGLVAAVVSRGGRPDLAEPWLDRVEAPTLLIVGGDDTAVLELNRRAAAQLRCPRELAIIPGATHLFEEPGALARVTELAADWFARHLVVRAAQPQ